MCWKLLQLQEGTSPGTCSRNTPHVVYRNKELTAHLNNGTGQGRYNRGRPTHSCLSFFFPPFMAPSKDPHSTARFAPGHWEVQGQGTQPWARHVLWCWTQELWGAGTRQELGHEVMQQGAYSKCCISVHAEQSFTVCFAWPKDHDELLFCFKPGKSWLLPYLRNQIILITTCNRGKIVDYSTQQTRTFVHNRTGALTDFPLCSWKQFSFQAVILLLVFTLATQLAIFV